MHSKHSPTVITIASTAAITWQITDVETVVERNVIAAIVAAKWDQERWWSRGICNCSYITSATDSACVMLSDQQPIAQKLSSAKLQLLLPSSELQFRSEIDYLSWNCYLRS